MPTLDADGNPLDTSLQFPMGSADWFRHHAVLRPLEWAYETPVLDWLGPEGRAAIRRKMREQQLLLEEAHERMVEQERAALQAGRQ